MFMWYAVIALAEKTMGVCRRAAFTYLNLLINLPQVK